MNPWPPHCERGALPAELHPQSKNVYPSFPPYARGVLGSFVVIRRQACFARRGRTEELIRRVLRLTPSGREALPRVQLCSPAQLSTHASQRLRLPCLTAQSLQHRVSGSFAVRLRRASCFALVEYEKRLKFSITEGLSHCLATVFPLECC